MGRRDRILTQILGFDGCEVVSHRFEGRDGTVVEPVGAHAMFADTKLVMVVGRRWLPRCSVSPRSAAS